jgi:peptide-methionine (R)-S-oxide reductase
MAADDRSVIAWGLFSGAARRHVEAALRARFSMAVTAKTGTYPVEKPDADWQKELTREQYQVLRKHATERAGTSPLDKEYGKGSYVCAGCGNPLFDSATKFNSGTGWPSFWEPKSGGVGTTEDRSFFMRRTEVHCANCGGHLGHVFDDGPQPTGQRYCMNGVAMKFVKEP